ncbi:hypothetical protein LMG28690_07338 [Paraburkholderia caffeinilytica]|nr:hypothetical protein LMG28690_07338 [Paraburkholderia caffeinilytica]
MVQRAPRVHRRRRRHRERVRPFDAEIGQAFVRHLQHLDFQHHLRFRQILRGDHLFGNLDGVRGAADRDGIRALVDHDFLDLQQALQQRLDLFGFDVRQLERAYLQFLIFELLGRRRRVDEKRIRIELLLVELILHQDHIDRVLQRSVRHEDCRLQVRSNVAVEDDVQSRGARQRFEDHTHVGVAKLQRDRRAHDRRSGKLLLLVRALQPDLVVDFLFHLQCQWIGRIRQQYPVHTIGRGSERAALHHAVRFLQGREIPAVLVDQRADLAAALAGRIDLACRIELLDRGVELVAQTKLVGLIEQRVDLIIAVVQIVDFHLGVGRIVLPIRNVHAPADSKHGDGDRKHTLSRASSSGRALGTERDRWREMVRWAAVPNAARTPCA